MWYTGPCRSGYLYLQPRGFVPGVLAIQALYNASLVLLLLDTWPKGSKVCTYMGGGNSEVETLLLAV